MTRKTSQNVYIVDRVRMSLRAYLAKQTTSASSQRRFSETGSGKRAISVRSWFLMSATGATRHQRLASVCGLCVLRSWTHHVGAIFWLGTTGSPSLVSRAEDLPDSLSGLSAESSKTNERKLDQVGYSRNVGGEL